MADLVLSRHTVLALLAAGGLLVGCAEPSDSTPRSAAEQFILAVETGDGEAACGWLSPAARSELEQSSGQPCPQPVLEEDIQGGSAADVAVFDTMAQVRFDSQAIFLSHFDGGWLVTAAACTPVPGRPYDCSIKGS